MAQELTFNITEDVRRLKRPTTVKDFQLSFGHADQGPTDVVIGDDGNIVQGRYGDSARQVFVNVVQGENNEPVDITGYLPEFNGCIPDAEHIVIDNWDGVLVDPRHGRFRFDFPIQAFTVAGSYKQAYFRLVQNGTGKTLATLEFDMQVLEDFVYSNIVPQDYVTPYLDMINKLKDAYTNFVSKTQDSFDQAKKRLDDIMSTVEDKADTVEQRLKIDEQALTELSKKIDEKGLFTQAEADAFKQAIQKQLTDSLTQLDGRLTNVEGNLEPYSVEQSGFNGKDVMHHGHLAVHKKTYGRYQNAAGMSVMVNGDDKAKVEGNSLEFIAKHYNGRDSAGLYVENSRIPYLLQTTDTKFTATSVTVLDESVDLSNVKPGMLIDTSKRANIDKDWYVTAVKSVDGNTINTELWYKVQSDPNAETVTGTPADGLAITVNPMVGAWGANFNIFIPQENAEAGTALELGVFSKSKAPQDIVGLRITSGDEFINNGAKATGSYSNAYDAANTDGGTAYNVDPKAKTDFYFRAQNPDGSANWFVNSQGQIMHESIVPHFATGASGDYGKDDSLIIFNGSGDQTINLDYGRYGRLVRVVAMSDGNKTIYANPESSSMSPGASWFLDTGNEGKNVNSLTLNKATGKVAVTLLDVGNIFAVL